MFSITRDNRLILPIINLTDYSISGYQTIETNGFKRVQGKVNGAIIYSGSHFLDNNYISESNDRPLLFILLRVLLLLALWLILLLLLMIN